ncbi:GldG family protein [Isosphaeraceae bacterium EP7]
MGGWLSRPVLSLLILGLAALGMLGWSLRGASRPRAGEYDAAGLRRLALRLYLGAAAGLVLVLAGVGLLLSDYVAASLPLFAGGFGTWITLARRNERFKHESPAIRRVVGAADAALTASLLAGVLLVGNLVAFRYGGRPIDLTVERSHSLSPLTLKALGSLDRPLTLTTYYGRAARSQAQLARVGELADLYRGARPDLVRLSTINPYAEPTAWEELARNVPSVALSPAGGVILQYGEGDDARRTVVRGDELFSLVADESGRTVPDRFTTRFNGEDALTSALIRLVEGKPVRVAFTAGHGEPTGLSGDPRQPSLALWKQRMSALGMRLDDLDTARHPIPDDLALLIIVAPKSPFQPDELAKVQEHMNRGGGVLLLTDSAQAAGLAGLLDPYEVRLGPGRVVDPTYNYNGRMTMVFAPPMGPGGPPHPIADGLGNRAVLVPSAAPLVLKGPGPAGVGEAYPILWTSPGSWVESDPDVSPPVRDAAKDAAGPIVVGLAITGPSTTTGQADGAPKMVVFSSPFLGDDAFVGIEPSNLDLLINASQWLRGKPELVGIAPKTHVALTLTSGPEKRTKLVFVPTVMAAAIIIALGVGTAMARRR